MINYCPLYIYFNLYNLFLILKYFFFFKFIRNVFTHSPSSDSWKNNDVYNIFETNLNDTFFGLKFEVLQSSSYSNIMNIVQNMLKIILGH